MILTLVLASSVAWAKPKASIFGLEVINLGAGAVGAQDTANAAALTDALRSGTSSKFELTNDKRELQDEKLMGNCQNEAAGCMSALARGAEYLILGNIEKKTHDGKEAYWIKVRVLNAKSKAYEQDKWQGHLLVSALKSQNQLKEWAGRVHDALAGGEVVKPPVPGPAKPGKLVVTIRNAKLGNVFVDGEKKGELADGTLTLTLPAGSHEVAIDAKDRKRHAETVRIASGETQTIETELGELVGQAPPREGGSGSSTWRKVMWTSVGTGIIGGAVWVYGYTKIRGAEKDLKELCGAPMGDNECPGATTPALRAERSNYEDSGNQGRTMTKVGIPIVGVSAALIAIGAWRGYLVKRESRPEQSAHGKRKRRSMTVTPVVNASGGGATLRFDW